MGRKSRSDESNGTVEPSPEDEKPDPAVQAAIEREKVADTPASSDTPASEDPPKRRGRPPGSKNKQTEAGGTKGVDPRILTRATRIFSTFEKHAGRFVAGGMLATTSQAYPEYPLSEADVLRTREAADLWADIRCKDMMAWLLQHPEVLKWLPEIVLSGAALSLVLPRAWAKVKDRQTKKQAAEGRHGESPSESASAST